VARPEGGRTHTESNIGTAFVDNAAGGRSGQGIHVLADAGVVCGLASRGAADGIEDAGQRALWEDGDVLRRGDGGQGGDDDG